MSCHYRPYFEQYKIKRLRHKKPKSIGSDKSALIIINVQNDFIKSGNLPISANEHETEEMVNSINELIMSGRFDYHIYVQDAHSPDHVSFASSHTKSDGSKAAPFEVIDTVDKNGTPGKTMVWPDHCKTDGSSDGINFHPKLIVPMNGVSCVDFYKQNSYNVPSITSCDDGNSSSNGLATKSFILWNGQHTNDEPYSAFKKADKTDTGLRAFLMKRGVTDIYTCGLARDFSVWWSAVDATTYINDDNEEREFNSSVIWDASLPVPGSMRLPDYNIEGDKLSEHQKEIKKLGAETVHLDLTKNNINGNNWIKAFLTPYGVQAVSHTDAATSVAKSSHLNELNPTPGVNVMAATIMDKPPSAPGTGNDLDQGIIDRYDDRNDIVYKDKDMEIFAGFEESDVVGESLPAQPVQPSYLPNKVPEFPVPSYDQGKRIVDFSGARKEQMMPQRLENEMVNRQVASQAGGSIFSVSNVTNNGKYKVKKHRKINNIAKNADPDLNIFMNHMFKNVTQ